MLFPTSDTAALHGEQGLSLFIASARRWCRVQTNRNRRRWIVAPPRYRASPTLGGSEPATTQSRIIATNHFGSTR